MKLSRVLRDLILATALMSAFTLFLFALRVAITSSFDLWFIPWNLVLAWIPLGLSLVLLNNLKTKPWISWQNILLSISWVVFLPNSWYVLTDFIHVDGLGEVNQLYDIVFVASLAIVGFTLGATSLYLVHGELKKRISFRKTFIFAELILLLSSLAVYLGRDLRWNTWDVILNPFGLLLDLSDLAVMPSAHGRAYEIILLFFALLSVFYGCCYFAIRNLKTSK